MEGIEIGKKKVFYFHSKYVIWVKNELITKCCEVSYSLSQSVLPRDNLNSFWWWWEFGKGGKGRVEI